MKRRNLPANVSAFVDRHGKERFRWRKTGFKTVMLKGHPGTAKKPSEEVVALATGVPIQPGAERLLPGTVSDLVARYYRSTGFTNAAASTQRVKRGIFEAFRAEFGRDRVDQFTFAHIEAIVASKAERKTDVKGRPIGGPSAAHELGKQLKRLFRYAVKLGLIATNPVDLADSVKVPKTGGIHTWTEAEIAQFKRKHLVGSKARLAMEIMLWTGQRRGDTRLFGPSHIVNGRIFYKPGKTKKGLWLPVAPQLTAAIRAMPAVGMNTYLVTEYGKPFSAAGFGNWFRDQCDAAGLPQCSAHGLRKAIARRLAESGATQQGLKAVGGWSGDAEVATYTAEVDQQALADTTLGRLWKGEE